MYQFLPTMCHEIASIDPDIVLLAGLDRDDVGISAEQAVAYKLSHPNVKLILRVNENDARKGTTDVDDRIRSLSKHIDGTVWVSNWLRAYFYQRGWDCKNDCVIINGVDKEIYKPQPKFNNGKTNIVAHHWSSHPKKGADIYEKLDELVGQDNRFTFTYIGRTSNNFKHSRVIAPMFGKALGEELGKYDVYVSASRYDPGPNHIIEAISCGLPTLVHKEGGGCVEFVHPLEVYDSWSELKYRLIDKSYSQSHDRFSTWQECAIQYDSFIKEILDGKR